MHHKEQHSETSHNSHQKQDSDELSTLVRLVTLGRKKGLPAATGWYSVHEGVLRRA